jgi:hypothetical protein
MAASGAHGGMCTISGLEAEGFIRQIAPFN